MKDVIIACDFASREELFSFLEKLEEKQAYLKIGMELFYACGASLLQELKAMGYRLFLDLKLHDIPHTVYKAVSVLANYQVDMLTLHAAGGKEMMMAARKALQEKNSETILLAVTQLTSTNEEMLHHQLWIERDMMQTVQHYAQNAKESACDGVICSPWEAAYIQKSCGKNFVTVTPGIRFKEEEKADQKRVATPYEAHQNGAHYIVMGRSITLAKNPKLAYNKAKKMFMEGQSDEN